MRRWLFMSLVFPMALAGCAASPRPASAPPSAPLVLVSFSGGGEAGDLPLVIEEHPDLAAVLTGALASLVESQSAGLIEGRLFASFQLVGATRTEEEIRLYAHESIATYAARDGTAEVQSARAMPGRSASMPAPLPRSRSTSRSTALRWPRVLTR